MAGTELGAALIIGSLAAGGSIVAGKINKPKMPGTPKKTEAPKVDAMPLDMQRSKRLAAAGDKNILTTPQGLGTDASVQRKSLLGT